MRTSIVLILLCLFASCARKQESEATADLIEVDAAPAMKVTQLPKSPALPLTSYNSKMIKTASYRFKVKDLKKSTDYIENGVHRFQGFISSSNLTTHAYQLENKMTIRVLNESFDDLLKYIDTQADVVIHRDVSTEDVSKEFVDLESRLKTKREVEARYIEILRSKAGTIEELLEAERQIGVLHEEIEATISRVNFLREQVTYSTINLEFYQDVTEQPIREEETFLSELGTAFSSGFIAVKAAIVGIIYIWPILIIALGIYLYARVRKKKLTALFSK